MHKFKTPYLTIDTETTIHQAYKRKASPFHPDNWVVYVGSKTTTGPVVKVRHSGQEQAKGWLARLLIEHDPAMLVFQNAKFDILHGIVDDPWGFDVYRQWVVNGGQVWDIQLAEYLLQGMVRESHMMSLDELAPRYGGHIKTGGDEIKTLWNAGVSTEDISEDLILPYLDGDILNTEIVFKGQAGKARKFGQSRSILLNMGALVCSIECERNGMHVDAAKGEEHRQMLVATIEDLKRKLWSYLPDDLPFEFNMGSRPQLSALIFGGAIKYKDRQPLLDADGNQTYVQKKVTHYVRKDGSTTADITDPDVAFFTSGKREGQAKTKQVSVNDLDKPKFQVVEKVFHFPGYTEPDEKWRGATPGVYSTAGEVLDELGARDVPFLKDLRSYSKLNKDLSSYYLVTDNKGQQSGMLTLVQEDGIIHHSINHTSTVTGRFSSSNPNLQNIPKGDKSRVKELFVSRWRGGKIIQSDFTSLEIYIQAILTGDKNLIKDLIAGLDMHVKRVAQSEHITYEEALRLCKSTKVVDGKEVAEFPEWVSKRTKAKTFSFQRAYGAGAALIAAQTGMTIEEVEALIEAELLMYPDVEKYYDRLARTIRANRGGIRKSMPHPEFPARIIELRNGYHRTPDGKLYAWTEHPSPAFVIKRGGEWTGFSPTELKNYEVQGGGAEWAKAAMWIAVREFYRRNNFNGLALLVNQVHDALYGDSHGSVAEEAAAVIHCSMSLASEYMEAAFNWPQPVYVPSETVYGDSMAEEAKVPGLDQAVKHTIELMRDLYIKPLRRNN